MAIRALSRYSHAMSKLTKKPKAPVLSRITKTLAVGAVVVSGCGTEYVGVPAEDAGPADARPSSDSAMDDALSIGVPPALDAGPDAATDAEAPDPGLPPFDAGTDAPPPGLPAPDGGS